MHGLGATKNSMSQTHTWIEKDFPGIYVLNIEIGNGRYDSFFMNINDQVNELGQKIRNDVNLRNGYNFICHSQGALLCRAFIERFNDPPPFNFISWAGPHAGQFGVPQLNVLCPDYYCPWLDEIFSMIIENAYGDWIQDHISFAAYWKDPFDFDSYLKYSHFIADINNERKDKNSTYKSNLIKLNNMVLVMTENDEIVIPNSSPWFQFYKVGSDSEIVNLKDTDTYQEDWIGLKTLDSTDRLKLYSTPCRHQDMPNEVCRQYYLKHTQPYLNNTIDD